MDQALGKFQTHKKHENYTDIKFYIGYLKWQQNFQIQVILIFDAEMLLNTNFI